MYNHSGTFLVFKCNYITYIFMHFFIFSFYTSLFLVFKHRNMYFYIHFYSHVFLYIFSNIYFQFLRIYTKHPLKVSKTNFITYNISLYNISYIKTSIFFNTSFKYFFFIIFYSSSLHCLSLLYLSF